MKKSFLSITAALCFGSIALAQIPNNSFETWTNLGSYDVPAGWGTMNNTTASYSVFTATKATPGNPGSAYIKLTSRTTGTTVTNGIAVSGVLDSITMKPKSGFAFTQRPATFSGRWQHMIYGSSQGGIRVLTTKWNNSANKRDTIAHAETTLSGMAMSWANFGMSMVYNDSLHYPDSCIIVMQASGNNPTNNDYLWIDNLAFTGTVAVVVPTVSTVGITEHINNPAIFQLYPSPAKDFLQVSYHAKQAQTMVLSIYHNNGQRCRQVNKEANAGDQTFVIDIKDLSPGIYFVQMQAGDVTECKKIVVQ